MILRVVLRRLSATSLLLAAASAASCDAILGIPSRETDPYLACSGPDECACTAPFAACGEASCRIDTRTDPLHCGACFADCGGGACEGGACACGEEPCKLTGPQCGCDPGLACDIGPVDEENPTGRYCSDSGSLGAGEACTSAELCRAGLTCIPAGDETLRCRPICDSDDDCSAGVLGQPSCGVPLYFFDVLVPNAVVCSDGCNPFNDDGCPSDGQCTVVRGGPADLRRYAFCKEPGALGLGESCTADPPREPPGDCGPGLGCSFDTGECQRWCGDDHPCPGGQTCEDVTSLGNVALGFCF
jgi:hypothetical protein